MNRVQLSSFVSVSKPFCGLLAAAAIFLSAHLAAGAVAGGSGELKFETTSPEARSLLQASGGTLIADYGSFQFWRLPASRRGEVEGQSGVTLREEDNLVELHAGAIHTTAGMAQAAAPRPAAFAGKRLHLVQFAGPIKPEWHQSLLEAGWQVVTYIPRNTYLVYGNVQSLNRLQSTLKDNAQIQWESEYLAEHKLHPAAQSASAKALRNEATPDLFAIQLIEDATANVSTLQFLDQIKRQWVRQSRELGYINCILRLPPERLSEVAGRPDVVSIQVYSPPKKQDERQGQILAGQLSGGQPNGPGYLAWLAERGFTAAQFADSGFVVDVSDSGIDNGTQAPGHFGLYPEGDLQASSRVAYNRLVGTPNYGSTIQSCDGHGNINAHIIAGYNALSGFPHTDAAGYHYGLGICPFVRVGSSVVFDPDTFTDPDFAQLQSRAYQDGARISCNSWGASVSGAYTLDCQIYDALVRDAQPSGSAFPTTGNQEMVIIFSAGNSGPGANSIGAPGSAKNILSVGAAENVQSHSSTNGGNSSVGYDGCNTADSGANSANDVIDFSSRGPCDDGRAKPDLTAPGTHITGGVGQAATAGANGTALACFQASGVCALPGGGTVGNANNFFPLGQQLFTTSSGTSHSCPAVGGGAALLRQYFLNHAWPAPSPAMTKAWLMNSTRYLTGLYANDTLPSSSQGMGSMNLGVAFDGLPRTHRDQRAEDRFTATGQARNFEGFIADNTKPFRVSLAWTDAPGSTSGNAYRNDLNLLVSVGGQTYRGNVFSGAISIPGGTADARNNAESVFLPAGVSGPFTVTVVAANINSDGVPNNGDALDQDFALVIYNASDSDAQLVPAGATLQAESCNPGQGTIDPGETVTLAFALRNLGPSNTTALVATLLPTGGVVSPSAPQTYGVVAGNNGPAVSRSFSFVAGGECGGTLTALLQLQDGTNDYGIVQFPLRLGSPNTNQFSVSNSAPISISAVDGGVSPYPSELTVSGLGGRIQQATVTLHGLSHSWPDDLDIRLVSPSGASILLLSEAGGGTDVTNLTLTFDARAANHLPDEGPLSSGTWQPTAYGVPSGGLTGLGALGGTDPNGAWKLLVVDDYGSDDGGAIAEGWSLTLVTTNRTCCLDPASADLALGAQATPGPVALSNIVTYSFSVTNQGPAPATAATLVATLSPSALMVGATLSQGTWSESVGTVTCQLGTLPPGAVATVLIQTLALTGPRLVTTAVVSAAELDPNLRNNEVSLTTAVSVPALSIQDTSVIEGDGVTYAVFLLTLSQPASQPVQVDYFTTNGTALVEADYFGQTNRLTFLVGEVSKAIEIPILGDTLDENDETFQVVLANPVNAALAKASATATILDDDPLPAVAIGDATVVEGNAGTTNAVFTVSLSQPSGRSVSVSYMTTNGTALAGQDYSARTNAVVVFAPGQTVTNLSIAVNGDLQVEADETFFVMLRDPVNATLGRAAGQGSILTDDLAPLLQAVGWRLVGESGGLTNGVIDPGEVVTLSLALLNSGSLGTTNLTATLLPSGGVVSPGAAQTYGVLSAGGPAVSRPFSFVVGGGNCSTLTCTLALSEEGRDLGTVSWNLRVGNCFFDDFDPGIDLSLWSDFGGTVGSTVLATNFGGSVSAPNALWFGDSGSRFATTCPLNTSLGGTIAFQLRIANGSSSTWEMADLPDEGIVLEYSTNSGSFWRTIAGYTNSTYTSWTAVTENIPMAAQGPAVQFRWRQLSNSSTGCDHWALDNVMIATGPQPPSIQTQPRSLTVRPGTNVVLTVAASGSSPLSFQWCRGGTNLVNGGRISGVSTSTLTIASATEADSGLYSVAVSNAYGALTSDPAAVEVSWLDHFSWGPISSPQGAQMPFAATLTARNFANQVVTNYTGCLNLSGTLASTNTVGTSTLQTSFPLVDYYPDQRAQILYLPAELGGAAHLTALALDVATVPSSTLSNWTIRLKHSPLSSYSSYTWESTGWTVVCQTNLTVTSTGWVTFFFSTPFDYNGTNSLMVDFSFNNAYSGLSSSAGNCRSTARSGTRTIYYQTYNSYGDPLNWSGSYPSAYASSYTPNLRLIQGSEGGVMVQPLTAWLTNGVWSANLTVLNEATNLSLVASDGREHLSLSNPFDVAGSNTPPLVTRQPASQTVARGAPASLCVSVWGTPPLSYQWLYFGTNLPGATNPCLSWISTTTNLTGPYRVVVTNGFGAVTSAVATLTVLPVLSLTEALDTPGWTWTTGGTSNWVAQTTTTHDGMDAAQSGTIPHSQNCWLQTTVSGPGTLSFWWKVSSEGGCDYLTFALDGVSQSSISGEQTWALRTVSLGSGTHTLRWTYSKDSSVNSGQDKAWLDQVTFTPTIGSLDHFVWATIGATQVFNVPFPVTIEARDAFENPATNFTGPANLSAAVGLGGGITGTILASPTAPSSYSSSGSSTLGYAFTPATNLTVTHVRHYFGTKVSIWTDSGTLLAAQNVVSTPGTWTETALVTPLQLQAGTRYRVAATVSGGNYYYWRTDLSTSFAYGSIDQGYYSSGDTFPVLLDGARWFFVDLRYVTGASEPVAMSPATAGPFVNGVWSGTVTVLEPGTNISLRAADTLGHSGGSGAFTVEMPSNTPPLVARQPGSQTVEMGTSASLCASVWGTPPLSYQWLYFGTNLPGATNPCLSWISTTTNLTGPYCVVVTNGFGTVTSAVATLTVLPIPSLAEALDTPGWVWTTGGASNWVAQTTTTHDGLDAAQSGTIPHSQSCWLQTTVTGPGTLSFWWKVSSESYYDSLSFTLDGLSQSSISGEQTWALCTFSLSSGIHTLRWTYSKNSSLSYGQDKAWLDQVSFVPTTGILDRFAWSAIGATQVFNVPFPVTIEARDAFENPATNFNGTVNLSADLGLGGGVAGTILASPTAPYSSSGSSTLGYAFTPTTNLTVTHVRHYFGSKVSIWTDSGTLLAAQNVVSTPGTWSETALVTPLQLQAGIRYRVAATVLGGDYYYWRTDLSTSFAYGSIDQGYSASGDTFPVWLDSARWFFVDLRYVARASEPVAMSPATAGPFVNGVWSGTVTVLEPGTNISLRAFDTLGHSGGSGAFTVEIPSNTAPVIIAQPGARTVMEQEAVTFRVGAVGSAPLGYQWRVNGTNLLNGGRITGADSAALSIAAVSTNDTGLYSVVVSNASGTALSSNAALTVLGLEGVSFRVVALQANNSQVVDHNALTGDDRGGIAVSSSRVFYNGDTSAARFVLNNLSGGVALGQLFDAWVSDLREGRVYSLANGATPLTSIGGVATALVEHDPATGLLSTNVIPLSTSISLPSNAGHIGLFAGYGRILVHNGVRMYAILLPTGTVVDLGAMAVPTHSSTENWAYWGLAEYYGGVHSIVYVRDSATIVRTIVPTGATTTLASFQNLGDMAAISASVPLGRWYFHYESSAQFGGSGETLGYAQAVFDYVCIDQPPTINSQPASSVAAAGGSASFSIEASGCMPLAYQWQFQGTNLLNATNATLVLSGLTTNQSGPYSVVVTNGFGAVTSAVATLTVLPVLSLADALDTPGWVWTTGGASNWVAQTTTTHDGLDAAQSGTIPHSQSCWLQTTVTGPGTLSFWWKVSSEGGCDYLTFYVDGASQASISGEQTWALSTVSLGSGTHTLRWTYSKDGSVNSGQDKAWLDQVTFTPTIGSLDHFVWATIGATQTFNVPFPVTIEARDAFENPATNFTGSVNLSVAVGLEGGNRSTILGSPAHAFTSGSGSYTLGYAFTPTNNLTVSHVRHYFGSKVSIWTDSGTLVAAQNVASTPGSWSETALATPVQLTAGTRYRVAATLTGGDYYWSTNLPNTFAYGTIDQSYQNYGDTFPTYLDDIHWWFVDLRFANEGGQSVAMSPVTAGPFVNGVWSGMATVLQPGTNISLVAADSLGHCGASSAFTVEIGSNTAPLLVEQPASQTIVAGAPASLCVSVWGTPPLTYQWRYFGTNLPSATNSCLNWTSFTTNQSGPYSVVVTNAFGAVTSAVATLSAREAITVAVFDDPAYVDTFGSTNSESDNVQASLTNAGCFAAPFVLSNLVSAVTNSSVILIPEQENGALASGLPGLHRAALSNAVASGKLLIVHGCSGNRSGSLLNFLFGFHLSETLLTYSSAAYALSPAAASTQFADDPSSLPLNSACSALLTASLPAGARSIYANASNSLVALIPYGNGKIVFLGWDWWNAAPRGSQDAGWLTVLRSAVLESTPVQSPPSILGEPQSQTVSVGGVASFSVGVSGTPPFTCQWRKNGLPLPGATNQLLTLQNVQTTDAGAYSVAVTNLYGSALSASALLTVVPAPQALFSANFEGGNDGFTVIADPNSSTNLWHRTTHRSFSPNYCQYYGLESVWNYSTGSRNAGNLQSPVISLAGALAPITLTFKYCLQTEASTTYDQARVLISANSGVSWVTLASRTNFSSLLNTNGFTVWTGDLSGYAGSNVVLRFSFDTIDSVANDLEGWYVDDVMVAARPQPALRLLPQGSFVNGSLELWAGYADGTPVTAADVARIRWYSTTNLALPFTSWQQVTNTPSLTNGWLRLYNPGLSNAPGQFFRAVQTP